MKPNTCKTCKTVPVITTKVEDGKEYHTFTCGCGNSKSLIFSGFDKERAISHYNASRPDDDDIRVTFVIKSDLSLRMERTTNAADWEERPGKVKQDMIDMINNL